MNALESMYSTLWVLLPELLLMLAAVTMMTACAFLALPRRVWATLAGMTIVAAIPALFLASATSVDPYQSPVINDSLTLYARLLLLTSGLGLILLGHNQIDEDRGGEYFGAILLLIMGSMLVACANELILLFVGLELVSIPTYFLLFFAKRDNAGREAATKYFFLSIAASAILLFGLTYMYGLLGISNLKAMAYVLLNATDAFRTSAGAIQLIAVIFVLGGLAFRAAAVPFHFYAPDVYQGSSTLLAAMLAWIPKAIGFLALVRVIIAVVGGAPTMTQTALMLTWVMAAATMTLGNFTALLQDNLKRLFAYSSIAHAGYLMMGVVAALGVSQDKIPTRLPLGIESILFYLTAYAFMTLGAFAGILALGSKNGEPTKVDDLSGLAKTYPWVSAALAICLLSLAGIPFTLGFWGKFEVFGSLLGVAWKADTPAYFYLAIIGAVNAAVGAYYYLRLIVIMYFREPTKPSVMPEDHHVPMPTGLVLAVCALVSIIGGMPMISNTIASRSRQAAIEATALPDPLESIAQPNPEVASQP